MGAIIELLRRERRARVFFAALAQSALGTGAGYVALLLIAYDRLASPWGIGLVLAADLLPAMFMAPLFGAVADRFSRRACTIAADVLRAAAFIGIALVDGFVPTLLLAGVAGTGTALFNPAALASLPSLVERRRLSAATALYGALTDVGYILGPVLAAALLLAGGPEGVMLVNGVTFAMSALLLRAISFGTIAEAPARIARTRLGPVLMHEAADGLRAGARIPGILKVLITSAGALFFVGVFNVAELLFVTEELGAGEAGFAILVAVFGFGFVAGSLAGSSGGTLPELKRRYVLGLLLMGAGFLASGLASGAGAAALAFAGAGAGNGMVLVYERLLVQATVPDGITARVFGLRDALTAWAFGLAFVTAGGLLELVSVRTAVLLAGGGGLAAAALAWFLLRGLWLSEESGRGADASRHRPAGEEGPDLVAGGDRRLAALDDLR